MTDRHPDLTADDHALVAAALAARERAHAPHSSFRVGAAVRTASGTVIPGCNVENPTYGLTLCAERVALMAALSDGETVVAIAVAVPDGRESIPCGICRQLLREVAPRARVILRGANGVARVTTPEALLPGLAALDGPTTSARDGAPSDPASPGEEDR
jgi:cytidine deaminase